MFIYGLGGYRAYPPISDLLISCDHTNFIFILSLYPALITYNAHMSIFVRVTIFLRDNAHTNRMCHNFKEA